MSISANTLPANHVLLSCDISSVLGEGGFGIVYRAWDRQLERFIAVKEYMPSALAVRGSDHRVMVKSPNNAETFDAGRRSFLNEARMVARFDHPSVVKIYQFWEENDTAYIAMPLYPGKTLRDVLRGRTGSPDEAWIKALLLPLLDALSLIHTHQCYHRDIAPDNIMILEDGSPVLIDFGAARRVIGDMTQALTAVLKPGFAPIEQYADSSLVAQGAWTDIYALSAVMHYVLTGKAPPTSVARVMSESYEPLERRLAGQYSPELLNALDRGLAVAPEKRPQSAAEFKELLFRADQYSKPASDVIINTRIESLQPINHTAQATTALSIETLQNTTQIATTDSMQKTANAAVSALGENAAKKSRLGWILGAGGAIGALVLAIAMFKGPSGTVEPITQNPSRVEPSANGPTSVPTNVATPTLAAVTTLTSADFYDLLQAKADKNQPLLVQMSNPSYRVDKERVSFRLTPATKGFVYIFLANAQGKAQLVFPNSSETNNAVVADASIALPRNNNFVASAPLGKSAALVILSVTKRNFDEILDFPANDFPEISSAKINQLAAAGQTAKFLGKANCANAGAGCEQFSVARVEFETYR